MDLTAFEISILDALQTIHSPALDSFMVFVTSWGNGFQLWYLLTLILLIIPKTRQIGAACALALAVDMWFCDDFLKHLFMRPRPFTVSGFEDLIVHAPKSYSFPSGHTAAGFAFATVLIFSKRKLLWIPGVLAASLVAFSRMYLYVHWPTDILGGIFFGALCGVFAWLIIWLLDKKLNKGKAGESASPNVAKNENATEPEDEYREASMPVPAPKAEPVAAKPEPVAVSKPESKTPERKAASLAIIPMAPKGEPIKDEDKREDEHRGIESDIQEVSQNDESVIDGSAEETSADNAGTTENNGFDAFVQEFADSVNMILPTEPMSDEDWEDEFSEYSESELEWDGTPINEGVGDDVDASRGEDVEEYVEDIAETDASQYYMNEALGSEREEDDEPEPVSEPDELEGGGEPADEDALDEVDAFAGDEETSYEGQFFVFGDEEPAATDNDECDDYSFREFNLFIPQGEPIDDSALDEFWGFHSEAEDDGIRTEAEPESEHPYPTSGLDPFADYDDAELPAVPEEQEEPLFAGLTQPSESSYLSAFDEVWSPMEEPEPEPESAFASAPYGYAVLDTPLTPPPAPAPPAPPVYTYENDYSDEYEEYDDVVETAIDGSTDVDDSDKDNDEPPVPIGWRDSRGVIHDF